MAAPITSLPDWSTKRSIEEFTKWFIEQMDRKMEADHQEHLKQMDEIKLGPPISYPIVAHSIPLPPVQEVSMLQVYPFFPIFKTSVKSAPI